jgi:hypothetical protein
MNAVEVIHSNMSFLYERGREKIGHMSGKISNIGLTVL